MKQALAAALLIVCGVLVVAQGAPPSTALTDSQMEEFLLHAKIVKDHAASKGVTGSRRVTLSDGTLTHDAHVQIVDEFQSRFVGQLGVELNFHDSWMYNIAAYKVDRLIGLNLIPPTVKRMYQRKGAAFTWWVDDVLMDEEARIKKKIEVPNPDLWNRQMFVLRVFDQLIGNTDRNLGNLLITSNWQIRAIDHTRAFRIARTLLTPANVTRCDRKILEGMKALDAATLKAAIGPYTYTDEIRSLLARRDEIVKILEKAGPAALYDR